MNPPKGQDVGQDLKLDRQADVFPLSDRFAEMGSIPVNDDGGEQVEPGLAVVLALAWKVEPSYAPHMLRPGSFHLSVIHSFQQARRCP